MVLDRKRSRVEGAVGRWAFKWVQTCTYIFCHTKQSIET